MSHHTRRRLGAWAVVVALGLAGARAYGQDPNADAPPPPPTPAGAPGAAPADPGQPLAAEPLTQGAVHEAFAGPVVYDPKAAPIIAKVPPQPIQEMPPDQKPEGANVAWIPGYWSWDDTRNDYVWISGVWRNIPPGRQWVPGYWHQVQGGAQWAPGSWVSAQATQTQYLGAPPASLESGPNSPSPVPGAVWAPGNWVWQDNQYFWRPGFWVAPQPNWVWVPAQYVWSPSGYMFAEGYWDRPMATRGQMFAPVYYNQPVYMQPNYVYQPSIGITTNGLMVSLFVRPSYHAYYFGNYYASNYVGVGIYPWYAYHGSRYGYDPLFSYYSVTYAQSNPGWAVSIQAEFVFRQNNVFARPPGTYREMVVFQQTNITINNTRNYSFAAPIHEIAARGGANGGMRFQRIEAAEQRQHMQAAREIQHFQQQRARNEAVAMRDFHPGEAFRPHTMELPKSPVAHNAPAAAREAQARRVATNEARGGEVSREGQAAAHEVAGHHEPPAHPAHPEVDANAQRLSEAHANPRAEPRYDATRPAAATSREAPATRSSATRSSEEKRRTEKR